MLNSMIHQFDVTSVAGGMRPLRLFTKGTKKKQNKHKFEEKNIVFIPGAAF